MPILDRLFSVVAPFNCIVCGAEGSLLCSWCKPDAFPVLPSRCYRCQRLSFDNRTCKTCIRSWPPRHVWVVTEYDTAAKQLLHAFKFERARAASGLIGEVMSAVLPYIKPETLIVPIPTATVRTRQRGYDHAELLARQIASRQRRQYCRAISRLTQSRQVGANRQQRQAQLKGAFMVTKLTQVKGVNILLVDDVVTTGATLEAAALVLKQAGAKSVSAVVFAAKSIAS